MVNDFSPERQKPQTNILDNLNDLLKPQNEMGVKDLYGMLLSNESVVKSGYKPTFKQFKDYFGLVKKGFEYVRDAYGIPGIPHEICVYQRGLTRKDADWIAYSPKDDEFGVSLLHIAGQAVYYDHPLDCIC